MLYPLPPKQNYAAGVSEGRALLPEAIGVLLGLYLAYIGFILGLLGLCWAYIVFIFAFIFGFILGFKVGLQKLISDFPC